MRSAIFNELGCLLLHLVQIENASCLNLYSVDIQKHPLRSYLDYIGYLFQKMDSLPQQERYEVGHSLSSFSFVLSAFSFISFSDSFSLCLSYQIGYRDFLQSPLQVS